MSSRQREEESRMMLLLVWATTKRMVSLITKIGKKGRNGSLDEENKDVHFDEYNVYIRHTVLNGIMCLCVNTQLLHSG